MQWRGEPVESSRRGPLGGVRYGISVRIYTFRIKEEGEEEKKFHSLLNIKLHQSTGVPTQVFVGEGGRVFKVECFGRRE